MSRVSFSAAMFAATVVHLAACDTPVEQIAPPGPQPNGQRIGGTEARRLVSEDSAFLLDVRSAGEFALGHIEGATNIPVGALSDRLSEVPDDRPVVVYCQSGGRSATAAEMLVESGRTVQDLGAMGGW